MKHLFIINPVAGKGNSLEYIPLINKLCGKAGLDFRIEVTKAPGHAAEIAAKYSRINACRFYSVGGDGTLNEIVNGIAGSGSSLAVIPAGSGNDFVRSIDYSLGRQRLKPAAMEGLLAAMLNGVERSIDLAKVNDRYFLNIASVGFDAEVVSSTIRFKGIPGVNGSMAYALGIFSALAGCRSYNLNLRIDGEEINRTVLLVAVANGKYYGGGMEPVPEAAIDDGRLDICLVGKQSRVRILKLFPKYMKGRHGNIKGVEFYSCRQVSISSSEDMPLNVDGEVLKTKKADFEIIPRGIKVIFPRQKA